MKKLMTLFLPLTLFVGCGLTTPEHIPYTYAERVIYEGEEVAHPADKCEFGYKKTYYITSTTSNLIFYDCLTENQAADLEQLADPDSSVDVAVLDRFKNQ